MSKSIPNHMPTLSAGAHEPGDGKACVMEYVSLLAGEEWTDSPACTHPVLARAAQVVNDQMPDSDRHLLVPLIGRLFGTAPTGTEHERKVLAVRLAVWCGRRMLLLASDRGVAEAALDTAEGWCEGRVTEEECANAADAAGRAANAAARAATYAAHAGSFAAHANAHADLPAFLSDLIDEYDRLTGRTEHRLVTPAEMSALAGAVASGGA